MAAGAEHPHLKKGRFQLFTVRTAAEVTPAWADEYVEKAVAAGVIEKSEKIDASAFVTREEAVRFIALAYNVAPSDGETAFLDNADIGAAYKPYVNAFQKSRYIVGKPGNIFDPQAAYTRAEAMQVLENTTEDIIDKSVEGQTYAKTAVVRKAGVTLKDTTVSGDLIIGQGVGDGDVTFDHVTVTGTLVVYGGGSHSIIIKGGSQIQYAVLNKQGGEPANIRVEGGSTVIALEVYAGSRATITGNVEEVRCASNATLEIAADSIIESMEIDGEKVTVYVRNYANATPSASTLAELRTALANPAIIEVNVPVILVNYDADLTIPAGKTVILAPGAGLSLNKLTVDGTLIGNAGAEVLTVISLDGAGLNPGGENGFFGMDAAYRPLYLAWYTKGAGVTTTGWWPTSVEVNTESALTDALAVSTVGEVHLMGNFTINGNHTVESLYISGDAPNITIATGAAVTADTVVMQGYGDSSLTVYGTLAHTVSEPVFMLRCDNTVTLDGRIIPGPDSKYFDRNIVRIIPWTGSAWGTPYLYNTDTGESSTYFPTAASTGELEYLAKTYPELPAINIYGAFDELEEATFSSFSSNYVIDVTVPVLIHGNQTFGFGTDADTTAPVVIGAGVTLTVESGAEVEFMSDERTKNAIVGEDNASKIVVQPGAEVRSWYVNSEFPENW